MRSVDESDVTAVPGPIYPDARAAGVWTLAGKELIIAEPDGPATILVPTEQVLLDTPVIVLYGTHETPEFQRQSRDFAAAARQAGKKAELIVGEGYNHFEIRETIANPYGLMGRMVLEQVKLVAV